MAVPELGPYFPTILKNIPCLLPQDFYKLKSNTTSDWLNRLQFSQSEVVLLSNASKIEKSVEQD